MKRLTALAATLLTLAVVPLALAAGGPGKFETQLTGTGAKTKHGMLDGTWTVDLNKASGKVGLMWNGRQVGGGHYVISGSMITFTPKGSGSCKTKGKYTFTQSGNKLTFTRIKDTCAVRRDVLTFGAWTKVG